MKAVSTLKFNQTVARLCIVNIIQIILITEVIWYQICGVFDTLGGL